MNKIHLILLILIIGTNVFSQNYFENFKKYQADGDTLKQKELLKHWEQEKPNDSELFTCLFNYYFQKSRNEVLFITRGTPPKGLEYLELRDSSNQVSGFISNKIDYEKSNLRLAFESIDNGIQLYPNRLDMRFGKIYALGQIKDWRSFTNEIIKTVHYSSKNNNDWTWTFNENKKDGKDFFLGSLQDYQMQLYNTMDNELLKNMRKIAQVILKHYPSHIESLSNLSITYLIEKQYNQALTLLQKAEEITPKDYIVLNNIAYCYREMNNKELAIKYYKKVIMNGDKRAIEQAKNEIEKLK